MDFTAIDFETANRHRDSACQLGAVRVRGGTVVDKWMWMIRPTPMYFSPGNIRVHGITPDRVAAENTFGELWPEISGVLDGETLIAHNASFDIGVLRACLMSHRCDIPEMSYSCTRAIARRTWPHRRRFGLKPLSEWLGVQFRHHDALEDSIACAKILLAAGNDRRAESLEELESELNLTRGHAGDWGTSGPSAHTRRRRSASSSAASSPSLSPSTGFGHAATTGYRPDRVAEPPTPYTPGPDLQRLLIRAEFIKPLADRTIAVAGKLKQMSIDEAINLTARLGGTWCDDLNDRVDILIVGCDNADAKSSREEAARLNEEGAAIEVMDESAFLGLIVATPV